MLGAADRYWQWRVLRQALSWLLVSLRLRLGFIASGCTHLSRYCLYAGNASCGGNTNNRSKIMESTACCAHAWHKRLNTNAHALRDGGVYSVPALWRRLLPYV